MKKIIVGIEDVNYVNKQGRSVSGVNLYITEDIIQNGTGKKSSSVFISGHKSSEYKLGEIQTVLYEPYGNGKYFRAVGVL